ncbi:TetR/AcrR family transcriptional regulator [Cellulosilyticum sp. ST5]|uniref:TetR/AcrR family transcriptional regulator n=1 Tax=unclassified Cellulosilyticum TaxID=2643091 RepID=UPI000F8C7994|nr:TetR/AcrR family transcriptional regulator [Cellulosilyticum sp. WCF-2]QEH67104.1 TetR/AcrR family transcriptional regulator [Cellulosilyticum sp. WCF-2]
MKQNEKKQLSQDKILNAAIIEFGTKSYENASLNNICSDNKISKGLIYHYFKNKDELYLCCVKICFDELTRFLDSKKYVFTDFQKDINHYLALRYRFFHENPNYSNIFFNTVLQPPMHLKEQIKEIRKDFDAQGLQYYKNALKNIVLREDITEEEAIGYFFIFQEMFNGYFQSKAYESSDFNSLIEAHEMKLSKFLNIMLYGMAKERRE